MGRLLAAKEVFKYRHPALVRAVAGARARLAGRRAPGEAAPEPLWSIFATYACTAACDYCVQNYSFERGRAGSPLLRAGTLPAREWLRLNERPDRPAQIVVTGGEPFLHRELGELLAGLTGFAEVRVVTNLTVDPAAVLARLRGVTTHRVRFHCSWHPSALLLADFLARAGAIREAGLLGSVRVVDTGRAATERAIRACAGRGIKVTALYQVGERDGGVRTLAHPEASAMTGRRMTRCRTNLALFAPDGRVYTCHTKLYWADAASSFGSVAAGFALPEGYVVCHDHGYCHPCQGGYLDLVPFDARDPAQAALRVLPSNPPPGVLPRRAPRRGAGA